MNDVVDVIVTNGEPLPVVASEKLPLDLLNRQGIVDRIMQLLNIISDNHSSCSFALNGVWGSGKTFVLNMLMKQLLDYQDGEKFLVFHYNCWQYDYYEEPLIAIVAAMMDSVDQETHVFSRGLREKAKQGMAAAKPIIEALAKEFVKKKIGVDLSDVINLLKASEDSLESFEKKDTDSHEYDGCYAFKKVMRTAQESIRELGSDRTVVVIVDELDRCLPGYAIKVMERLHHLFSGVENVAVILATDKAQIEQTVKQIFGDTADTTKYLKKFINFEIQLDLGRIETGFTEKYAEYLALFDKSLMETNFALDEYIYALFADIDVRTQERIIERIKLVHRMVFAKDKKDYSIMYFELMWAVLIERTGTIREMPLMYEPSFDKRYFKMRGNKMPIFSNYIQEKWRRVDLSEVHYTGTDRIVYRISNPVDIPHLLVWYLSQVSPRVNRNFELGEKEPGEKYMNNLKDIKRFVALFEIIQ